MTKRMYQSKNVAFTFLPHGDIKLIKSGDIMINQIEATEFDGSLNNIFLRVHNNEEIRSYPLIGKKASSTTTFFENGINWTGSVEEINYSVDLRLSKNDCWFWDITLKGNNQKVDVIYGQDIGLANQGVVQTNEAYNSQYVDYSVYTHDKGYVVCSRQNMPQGKEFPYLQQGSLTSNTDYSTDGYQFFEKNDSNSSVAHLNKESHLPSEIYQYEMAYTGLQSEILILKDSTKVVFYGLYRHNHPTAVEKALIEFEEVSSEYQQLEELTGTLEVVAPYEGEIKDLSGETLSSSEIEKLFPIRKIEEKTTSGELLSFFDQEDYHVVLKEKELQMERSHGHIILSGEEETIENPVMASTLYMNGLFNSQIVLGNTTVNKFISNTRNALNLLKKSGQRLFVKIDNEWRRLGIPSAFKLGFNFGTWYYKIADDLIEVTSYTTGTNRNIRFVVKSQNQQQYDWLTSFDIVMNAAENTASYEMNHVSNRLIFTPNQASDITNKYPDLAYTIQGKETLNLVEAKELFQLSSNENLVILAFHEMDSIELNIEGSLTGHFVTEKTETFEVAVSSYNKYIGHLSNQFHLELAGDSSLDKMNVLVKWYTHNMLVHYLSPHGLEQYGGAAWGTRDVCQGPVEYFFAMNKPEIVRGILLTLYSNQFDDDGNWPQWFMFDKFEETKADESHGDIIVWPLKVVSDYLAITNDYSILEEQLPYSSRETMKQTVIKESLLQHIEKQIKYIEDNFLEDTFLSCYGDGDWDDTLQPANQELKKNMASSWTVALTYQTLTLFTKVIGKADGELSSRTKVLAEGVYRDFHHYMLSDEVIPGFLLMNGKDETELIIHPKDTRTGIDYRLLPMTRSMIAELIDDNEVNKHYQIIQDQLKFPDAVRLMNQPAHYAGGVSQIFKRAEQAANLGREVGLAYIHAHIRYVEAMAKIGKVDETWSNLERINPIGLSEVVTNSKLRQSNAYFSSSDGDFKTRYDAQDNFNELKTQSRGVKGGWRIYSSGPGIYINQLVSNVLGVRIDHERMTFDPMLPDSMDGVSLTYQVADRLTKITFRLNAAEPMLKINHQIVAIQEETNRYRKEGFSISLADFYEATNTEGVNHLEIFIGEM